MTEWSKIGLDTNILPSIRQKVRNELTILEDQLSYRQKNNRSSLMFTEKNQQYNNTNTTSCNIQKKKFIEEL